MSKAASKVCKVKIQTYVALLSGEGAAEAGKSVGELSCVDLAVSVSIDGVEQLVQASEALGALGLNLGAHGFEN